MASIFMRDLKFVCELCKFHSRRNTEVDLFSFFQVTPIDGSSRVAYDTASDTMNGDMKHFKLQAISN